jgi:hypothetical protein
MRRHLLALLVFVLAAWAANQKLYLKDGSYQLVREYKVESDRVRFYSVERSGWEEIPLDLVDLKRTRAEASSRQAEIEKQAKVLSEEDAAERAIEKEIMRIPQDPGVYWVEGDKANVLKQAESTLHTRKGRSVLARMSPIPVVSGKGAVELAGAHSQNVFTNPEQEFYIQLANLERFGIAKLTSRAETRTVENVTFMPVTKEIIEEPALVDILRRQLTPDGLYKIWPKEPLAPGEYAVVEYTDGKLNMQIWDFAIKAK